MTTDLSQSKYFWINSEKYKQIELNRKNELNCANNIFIFFYIFRTKYERIGLSRTKISIRERVRVGRGGEGKESF